jgi:hypothetical protein
MGKYIFSIFSSIALLNKGAISSALNPAMPHPISVTRNFKSVFDLAKDKKSST